MIERKPDSFERNFSAIEARIYLLPQFNTAMMIDSALHSLSPQSHSMPNDLASDLIVPDPATLRILLAEDNLTNQKVALKQLQSLGYEADIAINGRLAVEAIVHSAKAVAYDLVLMDCQMPELDGYEAAQIIRAWEKMEAPRRQVVIVAMTASDLEIDRQQAIAAGMNDFITKPVRRETLATLLLHWNQFIYANSARPERSPAPMPLVDLDFFQVHLDLDHLHLLSDNCLDFERELLQLFTEDSWIHLAMLQQAIEAQDMFQIEQVSHHLKGASANVGAKMMRAAADRLELQGQHSQLQHPEALMIQLQESLQQIQHYLDQSRLAKASGEISGE